jgi:GNAT superfamily N-acetyltransferase
MLTLEVAKTECQLTQLLELVYGYDGPDLQPSLDLIQVTWDQFGKVFRDRGTAFRAIQDGVLVGGCWVELCGDVLRIHGLMVKAPYRKQGIGTWILNRLEKIFEGRVQMIELDVHRSKPAAIALYAKLGFELEGAMAETGFYHMRKWLQPAFRSDAANAIAKLRQLREANP